MGRTAEGKLKMLASSPDRPDAELDPLDPLDPFDAVHRFLLHVPRKGQHQIRWYGAYANRLREIYRHAPEVPTGLASGGETGGAQEQALVDPDDPFDVAKRQSWARLLQRVFAVNPLT